MRGKDTSPFVKNVAFGITPAHAGKRQNRGISFNISRDHPRTCGEKTSAHLKEDFTIGSPPHMRGKVFTIIKHIVRYGITPAHAGKSVAVKTDFTTI